MEDRWLAVDELGKYLGVSSDTVYRWTDIFPLLFFKRLSDVYYEY